MYVAPFPRSVLKARLELYRDGAVKTREAKTRHENATPVIRPCSVVCQARVFEF